jgi:multidrug efflux system outer membrane protein
MTMRRILALALATTLTGCMIGPDYRRPEVETPKSFTYEDKEAKAAVDTEWWKQFQDPVLDNLISEALANNKNVKIAAANIEQAAGVLTQTRSPLFPQVTYGSGGGRQMGSDTVATPSPVNPQYSAQIFAGASWELDLWGRVRRLTESARANLLATEEARRGVILSLVATVAGDYLQLRGLDEQLAIARGNLEAYAKSVELFELQFTYGQTNMMTVEQARTQYETAAASIPQIESQIAQLENALSILLGRNPGPIPRGKTIQELMFPAVPAGLPSQLLERRPDLLQSEQNLIAANAQIGAARAQYFPTIALTGSYGYASATLADLFKGPSRTWSYGGSITGPIFTAGAISGQVEQTEAAQKAALLSYEAAIQSAFADVENALVIREKLTGQTQAQERLVKASREYERLAKLQYDGGATSYLTVLNAQQQLFPAELTLAQLRASLYTSYANLYKAMGGGWVDAADKLTTAPPAAAAYPCMGEIEKFCKDIPPGKGELILCLSGHRQDLAPVCREKVDKSSAKLEEARKICAPDIEKYCPKVVPGQGRLLKCFKENMDGISPACRKQIDIYAGKVNLPPKPAQQGGR